MPAICFDVGRVVLNGCVNPGDGDASDQLRVTARQSLDGLGLGRFADPVGHVNGVEVRMRHKPVHGLEPDMVGIHVVGCFQPRALTAASAAARVVAGSEPMIRCSRCDLFQTGMTSTPFRLAIRQARSCAWA